MFEDVTIFQATLAAVQAICTWISQLHAKQQKIRQLGQTVQALSMVLEPLRQPSPSLDLDRNVLALLYDLLEILNGVRDHLSLWGGKMKKSKFISVLGFLNPSIALGMLSDDEKKVSQWINLFMLSLQIAILRKQVGVQRMEPRVSETMRLGESWVLYNEDVSAFWSKQVGEEVSIICTLDGGC
ncbi:hypothetical protein AX15_002215 [Amanita polypyramis BW_CC]|nr:hypothetical protein AX15_002215 [Amanita polypyramis BW_CC]